MIGILAILGLFFATGTLQSPQEATYSMSLDRRVVCQVPLVHTEKGTVTAYHCLQDLINKGNKEFYGINKDGDIRKFTLERTFYKDRGVDFAVLTDGTSDGVKIGDSRHLKQGQSIMVVSPKNGASHGTLVVVPRPELNPLMYIDIGYCGESGSGVFNEHNELIGIFIARTGSPDSPRGAMVPIHEIFP